MHVVYTQDPGKPLAVTASVVVWTSEIEWDDEMVTSECCLVCPLTDKQYETLLHVAQTALSHHSFLTVPI